MDYFRFFPVLYQADTIHLTLAQDGAYRRLIDHYMLTRQPLPDNDGALARIVGCGMAEWLEIAPSIRPFFKRQNGLLHNKRCNAELDWQDNKLKTRKEIAQKGVEARRNKIKGLATNGQPTVNRDVTRGEERRGEERKEEVSTPLPPKAPRAQKRRLDVDALPAEWRDFALKQGAIDPDATWDRFADYWRGNGEPKVDWFATWRNWVRRDLESPTRRNHGPRVSPLTSAVGRLLREGAEREPVSDGAGNPYLNGNDASAGLAHTPVRQIDVALPAAKRPWGG